MARRKVSPEAQIISLFTGLTDEGKRMVIFGLNAIMSSNGPEFAIPAEPTPRKKSAPKPSATPKDKPEPKAQASNGANCAICGNPADHSDHDPTYLSSHVFEAPGKGKKARKIAETNSENVSAVGVGAGD